MYDSFGVEFCWWHILFSIDLRPLRGRGAVIFFEYISPNYLQPSDSKGVVNL